MHCRMSILNTFCDETFAKRPLLPNLVVIELLQTLSRRIRAIESPDG